MGHQKFLQDLSRIALPFPFPRDQFYTRTLIAHLGSYGTDDAFLQRTAQQIALSPLRDRLCFEVVQYTANAHTVATLLKHVFVLSNAVHPLTSFNTNKSVAFFEFGITRAGRNLVLPFRSELVNGHTNITLINCSNPVNSYVLGQIEPALSTPMSVQVKLTQDNETFLVGNIAPSSLVIAAD